MPIWDFLSAIVPIQPLKKYAGILGQEGFAEAGALAYELAAKDIAAKNQGNFRIDL